MKIFEPDRTQPCRVRMFMAEKGLLDKAEFIEMISRRKPDAGIRGPKPHEESPGMELDDGTCTPKPWPSAVLRKPTRIP